MLPLVTVVIPTYRRDPLLRNCLSALEQQTLDHDLFEVIVVDDGPQESTRRMVEQIAEAGTLRLGYLRTTEVHGPAAARNLGWRSGVGVFIAFTDDDCEPEPGWLRAGAAALLCGADAVSGKIVVPLPDRPTDFQRNTAGLEHAEFATANCLLRRSALESLDGFDESFPMAWREDSDLHFRLLKQRLQVVRSELARVVHPARRAAWGASLRQERKTQWDAFLWHKHPDLCRQRLSPYPKFYYLHAAALLATVGGLPAAFLASNTRSLWWLSLTVWLVMTTIFAVKRLRGNSLSPGHVLEMFITSALLPTVSLFWHWKGRWNASAHSSSSRRRGATQPSVSEPDFACTRAAHPIVRADS